MKAADIDDRQALQAAIDDAQDRQVPNLGGCTWTIAENYFPAAPEKVVAAKLRQLKKRGLLQGCDCGCRGDWLLTAKGKAFLAGAISLSA